MEEGEPHYHYTYVPDDAAMSMGLEDGDTQTSEERTKSILIKSAFIVIVFFVSLLSGFVPIKNKRFRDNQHLLGIANTFSGGVFLAIAFIHIIPETSNNYYLYVLDKQSHKLID